MQAVLIILAIVGAALSGEASARGEEPAPKPSRIVSTNVCADQLTLLLAERGRIAALSRLAVDPDLAVLAEEARGLTLTGGRAEEIVPLKPDLVLANVYQGAQASRFLAGLGIRVFIVPEANSFAELREMLRATGAALGEPELAEEAVAALDRRLAAVSVAGPAGRRALILEPNGYTPAGGTLSDSVLQAAGFRNHAAALGVQGYGTVALERVVLNPPDLLIFDDYKPSRASRAQALLHHPALARVAQTTPTLWMPSKLWLCPGPWTAEAVAQLVRDDKSR